MTTCSPTRDCCSGVNGGRSGVVDDSRNNLRRYARRFISLVNCSGDWRITLCNEFFDPAIDCIGRL
jgi:hypothetical protein